MNSRPPTPNNRVSGHQGGWEAGLAASSEKKDRKHSSPPAPEERNVVLLLNLKDQVFLQMKGVLV